MSRGYSTTYPAILSAAVISAPYPFAARIFLTCAAFLAGNTLVVAVSLQDADSAADGELELDD